MIGEFSKDDFMALISLPPEEHDARKSVNLYIFVTELTLADTDIRFTQEEVDMILSCKSVYAEDFFEILPLQRFHIRPEENQHIHLVNQIINSENKDDISLERQEKVKERPYLLHLSDMFQKEEEAFYINQKEYLNPQYSKNIVAVEQSSLVDYFKNKINNHYVTRGYFFEEILSRINLDNLNKTNQQTIHDIFSDLRPEIFDSLIDRLINISKQSYSHSMVMKGLYTLCLVQNNMTIFNDINDHYQKNNKEIQTIKFEQAILNLNISSKNPDISLSSKNPRI